MGTSGSAAGEEGLSVKGMLKFGCSLKDGEVCNVAVIWKLFDLDLDLCLDEWMKAVEVEELGGFYIVLAVPGTLELGRDRRVKTPFYGACSD